MDFVMQNYEDENPFELTENFLDQYKNKKPPFGFNGLGELTYYRSYSRIKENGKGEHWWETCKRVVEGTYNIQKQWVESHRLGWNPWKSQRSAQEMYDRMFHMKFLPPGRGLWAMGTKIIIERGIFSALNNCSFVSTKNIKEETAKPFCFLMDMSMVGVGVGFDTKGTGKISIKSPNDKEDTYVIPDSREGWVKSVELLIDSYLLKNQPTWKFDYSEIRSAGEPIKTFGGVAPGSDPLEKAHTYIRNVLNKNIDQPINSRVITDLMNIIGKCVVAGGVRRTAEIAFGDKEDKEFLNLKNYTMNPEREEFGWASNNSIFSEIGMDYSQFSERISDNGEPGFIWLDNVQDYSRMVDEPDYKDHRVTGSNPCLEQSLESYEMCCLVESFPYKHESLEDFKRTLKFAYLYAKTVTLGRSHWIETNRVQLRNRRIGCSVSGVVQFLENNDIETLRTWLDEGYDTVQEYDKTYSEWLAIPRSIKTTSVKPSGTVSLLAGATPGVHFPDSRHYIRRIRLSKHSDLINPLKEAGYAIEIAKGEEESTVVVEIPVKLGDNIRTLSEVSMWEQLHLTSFLQEHWADNQVSSTVSFKPEESDQLTSALNYFQYKLKGISFLPRIEKGAYEQMPYEEITEKEYEKRSAQLKELDFTKIRNQGEREIDKFCTDDYCLIDYEEEKIQQSS